MAAVLAKGKHDFYELVLASFIQGDLVMRAVKVRFLGSNQEKYQRQNIIR